MLHTWLRQWGNQSISHRNTYLTYLHRFFGMFILIQPVQILLMQQSLTNSQISLLMSLLFLSVVAFELPTGAFADLFGKKMTIVLSYLAQAGAVLSYTFVQSFTGFALVILLYGLSDSLISGANSAMVYDSLVQDKRKKDFRVINANSMTVVQIAMVISGIIGGLLSANSLLVPFYVYGLISLLAAGIAMLMIEPTVDTVTFTWHNYKRQTIDGAKLLFRDSIVGKLALLYILVGGIGWTFQRLLRDMILIEAGYGGQGIGFIVGILRLINILFLAKIIRSNWLKQNGWDILLLPLLMATVYSLGFFLDSIMSLPIVAGIMIIGTGRFFIFKPYLQDFFVSKYRATTMSAANLLVSLLLAICMLIVGFLMNYISIELVSISFGMVSLLLVLPLSLIVRKDLLRLQKQTIDQP